MQDLVIILTFVLLLPCTVITGIIFVVRKIIKSKPPVLKPYEVHMQNFLNGSGYGELDEALKDEDFIREMEDS